jgi:Branched-chain amino acid transport system / permease component
VGLVFLRQRQSTVFGVAVALFWAVVLTIIMHIVLTRTRWGLHTVSVGGNLLGAREAGINVNRIKYGNFMLTGLLGATAMLSGTGTIIGAFLGAIVIGMLTGGFIILGVSANPLPIIFGGAILVAMIANVQLARLRARGTQEHDRGTGARRRHPARRAHLLELRRGDGAHRHQPAARQGRSTRSYRGQILLLDEPLAAMGVKEGSIILDLITRLKTQGNVSIIIIAHNYGQVREVCDRVNLIQGGEITLGKRSSETSADELTDLVVAEYRKALEERQRSAS